MSKVKNNKSDKQLTKEETLQAVVLADDFSNGLTPLQKYYPTILTPVANIPLFDYLIEILIYSGVQEVLIYGSDHINLLKDYVSTINNKNITIQLVVSEGCRSLGDALRDIDTNGWIRNDFILIRGNAFINTNLSHLMDQHRIKKSKDKGAAMSLILRDIGSTKQSMLNKMSCIFVSDKINQQVLFHKELRTNEKKVQFEMEWFLDHEQVEINSKFIDTHVYICSPSVLPLFSDNFDFQTMEDFIRGVLMNEEILDSRIYWQQLNPKDYALPLKSWLTYHTLTRDILQRQGYPLTPNTINPLDGVIYSSRNTCYQHNSTILARGCNVKKDSIIGKDSTIGKDSSVIRSIIGNKCNVGNNVTIENSYILNNVTINDNSKVRNSVVFSNCTLDENVELDKCISAPKTHIANNHSNNYLYEEDDDKKDGSQLLKKLLSDINDDEDFHYYYVDDDDDNTINNYIDNLNSDEESTNSSDSKNSPVPDDTDLFLTEVIDSLLRGYQDQLNCENLILEINSSRYAYNVSIREVTYNVVKAILLLPLHYLNETQTVINNSNYLKTIRKMIDYFQPILLNYIKTDDAQDDCLKAFEDIASTTQEFLHESVHILHLFYDKDILTEEKILDWYNKKPDNQDFYNNEIREFVVKFIDWLNQAEEKSSSEEDSD